jgi:hypothetical protein
MSANREHPAWRSPLHAIRDAISFRSSAAKLRVPAFRVIEALQDFPPADQLDAAFLAAVAMSQALGLDPHEMVARARRILPEAEGAYGAGTHIGAIRLYAKGELRK